ncbi:MAG: aminodeoxychorismate synthase component I [Gammaproteobacteria bacterium]|nr:aminodeoxychorismate synthase component I [Gammaproteobacteria bacterium]
MNDTFHSNLHSDFHTKKLSQLVDLLAVHKNNPHRYPFLLESVANGGNNSDYSILFAFPQEKITLLRFNDLVTDGIELSASQFIDGLNEWFKKEKTQVPDAIRQSLPFYGGWFVYLGYELAEEIEPVLHLPLDSDIDLPIAMASRIPAAIIVDKKNGESWLIAEPSKKALLEKMDDDIRQSSLYQTDNNAGENNANDNDNKANNSPLKQKKLHEEDPARYISAVKRIQEYIIEGDVFQVNVSRKWNIELEDACTPDIVYSQLRKSNPAPFAGLMLVGDNAVISSSPERLVSVKAGKVQTRPIAGTRPRLRDEQGNIDTKNDAVLRKELIDHPKERAEHVMLIDLERNDLGRISKPGSIIVDELMGLESYEHVHHIVSNVSGELKNDILPGDVIKAVFPGGTITGCPKIRCMEIIAELEGSPRQAYTGSMGYLNLDGDMDFNILIRTIIQSGKQLHIRAGAGIVAYSNPEKELQETRVKAKGMLKVITASVNIDQ